MKNFVLVIIFVCCFLLGFFTKKYFKLRKQFYRNLHFFLQNLINNISFSNQKLINYVECEKENFDLEFKRFLELYKQFLYNTILEKEFFVRANKQLFFLKDEEVKNLVIFLKNIGGKTKEEELEFLNNNLFMIGKKATKAEENYKKYANLYFKLFVILGIFLFIIFL